MLVRANIDLLRWESEFFGRKIGRILFDVNALILTTAALEAFELVQVKVSAQDTSHLGALGSIGFQPVLGEIDCCYTLSAVPVSSEVVSIFLSSGTTLLAPVVRLATIADIAAVRELAADALEISRFRSPWFNDNERRRFYAKWAENAILGRFDHLCFLVEGVGDIQGFVTLRQLRRDVARIGLLVVAPTVRERGIGRLLCNTALSWCHRHHFRYLWVMTQSTNLPALRLYLASGAILTHTSCWLYRGAHDSI